MAKTVLHTVEGRKALKPRHSPYWVRLTVGCYLGLRKVAADSPGAWVCRYRDDVSGKQQVHSLGGFDNLPPSSRYDAAKKAAEAWFEHRRRGGSAEVVTVRTACERYVQHLRDEKRDKTANDVEARFERWVYGDDKQSQRMVSVELAVATGCCGAPIGNKLARVKANRLPLRSIWPMAP